VKSTTRIALVGLGKVAHDQHLPTLAQSSRFELVAAASPAGGAPGVPVFHDIDELLASGIAIDAIAMCQPPQHRFDAAAKALRAGLHVLLEKPPAATPAQVEELAALASSAGTALFTAWHSRYAPAIGAARAWLRERRIISIEILWKEDVRRWHPGQQWIWEPEGFGVFDAGINALSIATCLLPGPLAVCGGTLEVPCNRGAPIAAQLHLQSLDGVPVRAVFDWRQSGPQTWDILLQTDGETLTLREGGARLSIGSNSQGVGLGQEYRSVYAHFTELIDMRRIDVDAGPLQIVADAAACCQRRKVERFED
jgi:D-galactose 1-dehydrogenase